MRWIKSLFSKKEDPIPFKAVPAAYIDERDRALLTGHVCVEIIDPVEHDKEGKITKRRCYIKAKNQEELEVQLRKFAVQLCQEWNDIGIEHLSYRIASKVQMDREDAKK